MTRKVTAPTGTAFKVINGIDPSKGDALVRQAYSKLRSMASERVVWAWLRAARKEGCVRQALRSQQSDTAVIS